MAQQIIRSIGSDGLEVLSNILDKGTGKLIEFKEVSEYYDGTPMSDGKLDAERYLYIKNNGKYYLRVLDNPDKFLEKDTMIDMRNISNTEILLLKMGYYKGITLNGYYEKGDTPSPIKYYLSNIELVDNGGNIININNNTFIHNFIKQVDAKYFGAKGDGIQDDSVAFQKAADLRIPIVVTKSSNFYYITNPIRIYKDFIGIDYPEFRTDDSINTITEIPLQSQYSILMVINKIDDEVLTISGLKLDGRYNNTKAGISEQEHCIRIACCKNIDIINNHIINASGDCINIGSSIPNIISESRLINNSYNINIINNVLHNPYRCSISITGASRVLVEGCDIKKIWDYVASIDIEIPRNSAYTRDITIRNNRIEDVSVYSVTLYGGYDPTTMPSMGFSTENIIIDNNIIINTGNEALQSRCVNISSSEGSIKNVIISNNTYLGRVFVKTASFNSIYYSKNITIRNNHPLYDESEPYRKFAEIDYLSNSVIENNSCYNNNTEAMLDVVRSNDIIIKGNNFSDRLQSYAIKLSFNNSRISIKENIFISPSYVIFFSGNAIIDNLIVEDNILLKSINNHIMQSNVLITGISINNNNIETSEGYQMFNSYSNYRPNDGQIIENINRGIMLKRIKIPNSTTTRAIGIVTYGPTNQRSLLNPVAESVGVCYFDTTLNKPIWWNGSKWVDSTGADI